MLLLTLSTVATLVAAEPSRVTCEDALRPSSAVGMMTSERMQSARAAAQRGDLDHARREYRVAVALGLDEGCLPVEASHGLARLLFAQSQSEEAAHVMEELASEARASGNVDVEARALVSAAWLQLDGGQRLLAKENIRRLHELSRQRGLSSATRALLKESLG
jgi:Tfp pilus assembly protein PilF